MNARWMALVRRWVAAIASTVRMAGPKGFTIIARPNTIVAEDGFPLEAYCLERAGARQRDSGLVLYIQGSNDEPVLNAMAHLAGFVMLGMRVLLVERRGVHANGTFDATSGRRYATRIQRVQDVLAVLRNGLDNRQSPGPVMLAGVSEGGSIAVSVAAVEPRVTHLALFGTGGWPQAEELRHFVREQSGYLGIGSLSELEAKFEEIRTRPDSDELWLGHTFRRWSAYLWHAVVDDAGRLNIPVFQAHGMLDQSVPLASARAIRETIASQGKCSLQYVEYETLDHRFRDPEGKSGLALVEVDVLRWLAGTGVLNESDARHFEEQVRRNHPERFG